MGEKTACGKSTQDLLLEFQQTGSQAPFEEIARRYAGMVYNVALQVTKDAHDAEDATQATFLTLAVHAKTAGKIRFVGPWLRKVSQRLALDIRRSKKRRTSREQRHAITHAAANGNGDGTVSRHDLTIANSLQLEELRDILRNELDRLPTKYRMPLILYYFGGLTPEQIGQELKCKTSTLGVRLHRGRKMLAENLSSRGITINSATAGLMLAAMVDSSIRDNLVHACTHAAVRVAGNGFVADATISAPMLAMVNSVTSAIRLSRLKGLVAAGVLLLSSLTGAAAALERYDIIKPETLRLLNPLRLIRPLMDRLLRPGSFSIEYSLAGTTTPIPSEIMGSGSVPPAGPEWGSSTVSTWPSPPPFVTGAIAHVGSERVLPSQFPGSESFMAGPLPSPSAPSPLLIAQPIAPFVPSVVTQNTEPGFTSTAQETALPATPPPALTLSGSHVHDVLVIDRSTGVGSLINANSTLLVESGLVQARQLIVGDSTEGAVVQTGGTVAVSETVVIANQPTSTGTYTISNDSTLATRSLVVAAAGNGTVIQTGGVVSTRNGDYDGSVIIGEEADSEGTYVLKGGILTTDRLVIGKLGVGALFQSGGEVAFQVAQLGEGTSGRGTWSLSGGSVQVTDSTPPPPAVGLGAGTPVATSTIPAATNSSQNPLIVVGGAGSGTILLNSTSGTAIGEQEGSRGATVLVRPNVEGMGVIRGHGRIELSGPFISNGKVIADGFGTARLLDLSGVSTVTNILDNVAGGANGWYARDGGALRLPVIRVYGSKAYTWGEFQFDHQIDLVNSVRFTPQGDVIGEVDILLLDPMTRAVPRLDEGQHAMSLWSFAATFEVTDVDLMVRYDDLMATMWRISENDLVLWAFEEGQWQKVTGEESGIDVDANLIWGRATNPRYFAVAPSTNNFTPLPSPAAPSVAVTPEPTTVTALALIAGTALMRRRRR